MYNTILTYIYNRIYDNGQGEIDPTKMRQVFQQCINELGADANFMGVVSPSDNIQTPDAKQVYLVVPSATARTFSNFDNITVSVPAYAAAVIWYDNDQWNSEVMQFDVVRQTSTDENDDLHVLLMPSPTIDTGSKTAGTSYNKELSYNPQTGVLSARRFSGDGSLLTNLPSAVPTPTAADEGKMLQVNASGQYELVTIVNSELQPY